MTNQRDIEMIRNQDSWPSYPLLPLTRGYESAFVVGDYLVSRLDGEITMWRGNMWELELAFSDPANRVTYPNADAVIADGWKVD